MNDHDPPEQPLLVGAPGPSFLDVPPPTPDPETPPSDDDLVVLLGYCGCVEPSVLNKTHEVLAALRPGPDKLPQDGAYDQVRHALLYSTQPAFYYGFLAHLASADLIEHGIAIRCAWLTRRGKHMLSLLDARKARQTPPSVSQDTAGTSQPDLTGK